MKITKTSIEGCFIIEPVKFGDNRGWFSETYNYKKLEEQIKVSFVQDNESFSSAKGTIRGMHAQYGGMVQAKLVRCVSGSLIDKVYDARPESKTFGKKVSVELNRENHRQLFVPEGCLHGFETTEENTIIQYKVNNYYSAEHDVSVKFDDDQMNIEWINKNPTLSKKDSEAIKLSEYLGVIKKEQ